MSTTAPSNSMAPTRIVARLAGQPITMEQLQRPLLEGYGLVMLLNFVQLEYVKQQAIKENITVSPQEIKAELDLALSRRFAEADKSEYEQYLNLYLQQTHTSRIEFDTAVETNAYLRKLAEPTARAQINDATLQEAFRQLYGETVQVRHIQVGNMQEIIEAKRKLAAGEPFEQVAKEMSRNARTAELGGELPPFSRQAFGYPQAFKDAAFALKEGEVSEAVEAQGAYHLIKLEKRFAPKAVKFEDVKDSLREDLLSRLVEAQMQVLKEQVAHDVIRTLIIEDPTLQKQYEAKIHQSDQQITNRNEIKEQFERERAKILQSATQPTTGPALPSAPVAPEVARPPASMTR